jgi:hypothetical protein
LSIYFPGRKGVDFPHPGVGPYPSSRPDPWLVKVTDEGDEIRHAWYQWVVFVLFFQVKIGDDSSFRPVLRIRIRDPRSGAFLTPGSGIRNRFLRIPDPKPIFLRAF